MTAIRLRITENDLKDIKPDSELYKRAFTELTEFKDGAAYREYAYDHLQVDGKLEFDDDAAVSMGCDGGAYVMCWKWVDEELLREEGYLEEEKDDASKTD